MLPVEGGADEPFGQAAGGLEKGHRVEAAGEQFHQLAQLPVMLMAAQLAEQLGLVGAVQGRFRAGEQVGPAAQRFGGVGAEGDEFVNILIFHKKFLLKRRKIIDFRRWDNLQENFAKNVFCLTKFIDTGKLNGNGSCLA